MSNISFFFTITQQKQARPLNGVDCLFEKLDNHLAFKIMMEYLGHGEKKSRQFEKKL